MSSFQRRVLRCTSRCNSRSNSVDGAAVDLSGGGAVSTSKVGMGVGSGGYASETEGTSCLGELIASHSRKMKSPHLKAISRGTLLRVTTLTAGEVLDSFYPVSK